MAVNSDKKEGEVKSEFPKLMISDANNIWLMENSAWGVCVHCSGQTADIVGGSSINMDYSRMTPFTGSITLSNE